MTFAIDAGAKRLSAPRENSISPESISLSITIGACVV